MNAGEAERQDDSRVQQEALEAHRNEVDPERADTKFPQPSKNSRLGMLYNHQRASRPPGDLLESDKVRSDHISWGMTGSSLFSGKFKPPTLWCYFWKARGFLDNMVKLSLGVKSMLIYKK